MGDWDLKKFYYALHRVLGYEGLQEIEEYHDNNYWKVYKETYYKKMASKLGIMTYIHEETT